jgi:hypothetical protein
MVDIGRVRVVNVINGNCILNDGLPRGTRYFYDEVITTRSTYKHATHVCRSLNRKKGVKRFAVVVEFY